MRYGPKPLAKLMLLAAIWGSAFLCIDLALISLPPMTIAATRIFIAASALGIAFALSAESLPKGRKVWLMLCLVGFLSSAAPFVLISWGQQYIDGGTSGILMASGPFLALTLSHFTSIDDRFSFPKVLAIIIGFCGVSILIGVDALNQLEGSLLGKLAVVAAAFCYVTASVMVRNMRQIKPLTSSFLVLATAGVYLVPLALWFEQPWTVSVSDTSLIAIIFLGLFPTALGYLMRIQLIHETSVSFLAQVSYLIPVFAVFWGWLFLQQIPQTTAWIAMTLILSGLWVSRQEFRWPFRNVSK